MATVLERPSQVFGPRTNGIMLTPREFDRGDFEEGWRYELINGVLVVTSTPLPSERDPNQSLGHWLLTYQESHPQGFNLDHTLNEHTIVLDDNRRRADRVLWTGLGRLPRRTEVPSIVVEFVSAGRKNWTRDYETKRDEYLGSGIKEYWIFDRFARTLTVFTRSGGRTRRRTVQAGQMYQSPLLPGFELSLTKLLDIADRWGDEDDA